MLAAGNATEGSAGTRLFPDRPPGGGWQDDVAARCPWLDGIAAEPAQDRLVVMHENSSRVLRGLLTGAPDRPGCGAPIADPLPQGAAVEIVRDVERVICGGPVPDPRGH